MPTEPDLTDPLYDRIGPGYGQVRRTEPRIASRIWAALGDAQTVLNVGASTGSYKSLLDRDVRNLAWLAATRAGIRATGTNRHPRLAA